MTATIDKTSDSRFHDFILANFGMTPFLNTYPDFMAGGAVTVTALFIAAGMEVSQPNKPQRSFCALQDMPIHEHKGVGRGKLCIKNAIKMDFTGLSTPPL
jgi:hypothetical protein